MEENKRLNESLNDKDIKIEESNGMIGSTKETITRKFTLIYEKTNFEDFIFGICYQEILVKRLKN